MKTSHALCGALFLSIISATAIGSNLPPPNCSSNGVNTVCVPAIGNITPADRIPGIDQRQPAQTDDSGSDYGSPWSFWSWHQPNGTTRVFNQLLNNAGFPQWKNVTVNGVALPADAMTAACAWGVWTQRIKASYTGNLLKAQFADATTFDVPQLSGGKPDQGQLWAMAALHGFPARVTTWYDQCNGVGTGFDATQTTAANQPLLTVDRDGDLAVVYDRYADTTTGQNRFLNISNGLALTTNAWSAFTVMSFRWVGLFENIIQIGGTGGATAGQLYVDKAVGPILRGGSVVFTGYPSNNPTLIYTTVGASNYVIGLDGHAPVTTSSAIGANAVTGGLLGMAPGSPVSTKIAQEETIQYGAIIAGSQVSAANVTSEQIAIHAMGKTTPQARCNVVTTGESVMYGLVSPGLQSWTEQLQDMLPKSVKVINFAQSSQGIGLLGASNNIALYPIATALAYNAADRCNILIINGGNTNDWWNGGSGSLTITVAQEQAFIDTLVAMAHATGFQVFVMTAIDREGGDAAHITQRIAMTASIKAAAAVDNYIVIPVDLDPEIGPTGALSNAACSFDGAHLTEICAASLATDVRNVIAPYIRSGG